MRKIFFPKNRTLNCSFPNIYAKKEEYLEIIPRLRITVFSNLSNMK
jgi:hypothetical protein